MSTPWGKVKPSDVQLVHRYKWSEKEHESMCKTLKNDGTVNKNLLKQHFTLNLIDRILFILT